MSKTRAPKIGDRIRHPDWGAGKVLGLVRGGRVLKVEFDEMPGVPWEIPREKLEKNKLPLEACGERAAAATKDRRKAGDIHAHKVNEDAVSPSQQNAVTARQAIEALRLGVVPTSHLDTYTVGRDIELAVIYLDLESATRDGGFRIVLGTTEPARRIFLRWPSFWRSSRAFLRPELPWTAGKCFRTSHGESFTSSSAAYAIRMIRILNPAGSNRCWKRPQSMSTSYVAGVTRTTLATTPTWGAALFYMAVMPAIENNDDLLERLLDWIEGSEVASNVELEKKLRRTSAARTRLFALKDFRTVTHLYTLILGGIAELARQVGYKGLAIMVDEAEFYSVLRGQDRTFADILFRTFAAACLPRSRLKFDPAVLPRGGQAIHRSFSYRYKEQQPLYCIFALTHDPEGKAVLEKSLPATVSWS